MGVLVQFQVDQVQVQTNVDTAANEAINAIDSWVINNPTTILTNQRLETITSSLTPYDNISVSLSRVDAENVSVNISSGITGYQNNSNFTNIIDTVWVDDAKTELQTYSQLTKDAIDLYVSNNPSWTSQEVVDAGLVNQSPTAEYENTITIFPNYMNETLPPYVSGRNGNIGYSYQWNSSTLTWDEFEG